MPKQKTYHFAVMAGGMIAAVAAASYPVIIEPMNNPEPWRKASREFREKYDIKQENIQPGGMKVWTDPFDRPGKPGNK